MSTIYDIDRDSIVIVNETYPDLHLDCGYFRTDEDRAFFSITSTYTFQSAFTGRAVRFYLSIYMDEIFGADDFVFEDGKAYLKSFKTSDNYEFECQDPETSDQILAEIYEFIDSKFAGRNAESTYTLTASLKQN